VESYLPKVSDEDKSTRDVLNTHQIRALERRKYKRMSEETRTELENLETKKVEHAIMAANAEMILHTEGTGMIQTENELERSSRMTQRELKYEHLDEQTARQVFNLELEHYGPYKMNYSRSGRHGILYGRAGHVAMMDCHQLSLVSEIHLNETVHDGTFLHNETLHALAQKDKVFIYDNKGAEIHCMKEHSQPLALQFLPYHFLLASVGRVGVLRYHDTSTGSLVSQHRTKLGSCSVLKQNPTNAVLHCGHNKGFVTLWSPSDKNFLVKMLCHPGANIRDLAIDLSGKYMVTAAADSRLKVWDLRMYKELHSYFARHSPATSLDISQRGILGVGHGRHTTFWPPDAIKIKEKNPYMTHYAGTEVHSLRFRPFEDVCAIGHENGLSSIVIPGAGEPNLDSTEHHLNPYQDTRQRRETEVRSLLDKLAPDMIHLENHRVGMIEGGEEARLERTKQLEEEANRKEEETKSNKKVKHKMRGKSTVTKKIQAKQRKFQDINIIKAREKSQKKEISNQKSRRENQRQQAEPALKRFFT